MFLNTSLTGPTSSASSVETEEVSYEDSGHSDAYGEGDPCRVCGDSSGLSVLIFVSIVLSGWCVMSCRRDSGECLKKSM
jgi:hypothetical protein